MVSGFFKHMYQYFVPKKRHKSLSDADSQEEETAELFPVYDKYGEIEGYTRRIRSSSRQSTSKQGSISKAAKKIARTSSRLSNELLYKLTPEGYFAPVASPKSPSTKQKPGLEGDTNTIDWDGWPDGEYIIEASSDQISSFNDFKIHWANRGRVERGGNEHADTWEKGKQYSRTCLGVIVCDNPECNAAIRPGTTKEKIIEQLQEPCPGKDCYSKLFHHRCDVKATTYSWSGGVRFCNSGVHAHARPHPIHMSNKEREHFSKLVKDNPNTGPLGLIVGVPGIEGPGESVADISPVLLNIDRVSKERRKIKNGPDSGGDQFIAAFAKFDEDYPGFVIFNTIGQVTVISLQTPFMRSNLVKSSKIEDRSVNGTVNDAAHGWWRVRNSLLMITSAYSPLLFRWVPGVMSYTNGATKEHFKYHFLAVFRSMAHEAELRGLELEDWLFAGIVDFSEAERAGFILAYIEFWLHLPNNTRTEEELLEVAKSLLKGCQEHYRAGVTRISRMTGVIPPDRAEAFKKRALALLRLPSSEEFIRQASLLVRDFPKIRSWMEWWMRPAHASMLFESERKMDIAIWESIPDTNNAEEAMHWKIYSACGRDHALMEGLRNLYAVAAYYERLARAAETNTPLLHGKPEYWIGYKDIYGRTKPSRAPDPQSQKRKKNDGRPPDTKEELLQPAKKKRKKNDATSDPAKGNKRLLEYGPPSYPWKSNSCWLDTSLELIFVSAMRNFSEFSLAFASVPKDSPLYAFYKALDLRREIDFDEDDTTTCEELSRQRDDLRGILQKSGIIQDVVSAQPLMAWFYGILRMQETNKESTLALSYFCTWMFDFHSCAGSQELGGYHIEITHPRRYQELHARPSAHRQFKGQISNLFHDFVAIDKSPIEAANCWRVKEGKPLCPGTRIDYNNLVISLPIIFTIDVDLEMGPKRWNFPQALYPLTETEAIKNGLQYELVGLALVSTSAKETTHFIARHASADHRTIYTYDGLAHKGLPLIEPKAKFQTHVAGNNIKLPQGFVVYQAFYHLQGGLKAQRMFYELRTKALSNLFKISFSEYSPSQIPQMVYEADDLTLLDPSLRTAWSKRRNIDEYISIKVPKSKPFKERGRSSTPSALDPEEEEVDELDPEKEMVESSLLKTDHNSQSSSLPDEEFELRCRCGLTGDGNALYQKEEGLAIQCSQCSYWSHVACQKDGLASDLAEDDEFICGLCDFSDLFHNLHKEFTDEEQEQQMAERTRYNLPLHERLRAGRGALVRHGKFWYPVRLLQRLENQGSESNIEEVDMKVQWRVRWWRGCQLPAPGPTPDLITIEDKENIVDSLWKDQEGRRKIRLGRWTHSWDIPTAEDILSDPSAVPYTEPIDDALAPAIRTLKLLLNDPLKADSAHVPAKAWLQSRKKNIRTTLLPYTAGLSVNTQAQISNWFEAHISETNTLESRNAWIGPLLPLAHAYTVYISSLLKRNPKYQKLSTAELLEKAWEAQLHGPSKKQSKTDVDRECLQRLEEEMFEDSARAGVAGNWQWGLDAGEHNYWNPYDGRPQHLCPGDREGSDTELETGPQFERLPPLVRIKSDKIAPRPRPVRKNTVKKVNFSNTDTAEVQGPKSAVKRSHASQHSVPEPSVEIRPSKRPRLGQK